MIFYQAATPYRHRKIPALPLPVPCRQAWQGEYGRHLEGINLY